MSKTKEFLEGLNDVELSFLFRYKFNSYLPQSQELVIQQIDKRGLSEQYMAELIKKHEFNPENMGCNRCGSLNSVSQQVDYHNTTTRTGPLNDKTAYTSVTDCAVCGYTLYDGNMSGVSLLGRFGRLLMKKLKK